MTSSNECLEINDCLEACLRCMIVCQDCGLTYLQAGMRECAQLCLDCAEVCDLCSTLIARNADCTPDICALCEDICNDCARQCREQSIPDESCKVCAIACEACAEECARAYAA